MNGVAKSLAYLRRSLRVILDNPREGMDRIRDRCEIISEPLLRGRGPRASQVEPDVIVRLHRRWSKSADCQCEDAFADVWSGIASRLEERGLPFGLGHDADMGFARAVWSILWHERPRHIVETGVARGITTSVLLAGLANRGGGKLWSIDLPPVKALWHEQSAAAVTVPDGVEWRFIRGSSRRHLEDAIDEAGTIDAFVHDSLHTRATMQFEMTRAWSAMSNGGILLADDVEGNSAFTSFCRRSPGVSEMLIGRHDEKDGLFGVAFKSGIR